MDYEGLAAAAIATAGMVVDPLSYSPRWGLSHGITHFGLPVKWKKNH
jgi:hypothetical protein